MNRMPLGRDLIARYSNISANLQSQASARWTLSLAVANGAGVVAVATHMLSAGATEASIALLMPTAWMFVIGVTLAGCMPALAAARHAQEHQAWELHDIWAEESMVPPPTSGVEELEGTISALRKIEVVLGLSAAALFFGGMVYPLAVLVHRYNTIGSFLG